MIWGKIIKYCCCLNCLYPVPNFLRGLLSLSALDAFQLEPSLKCLRAPHNHIIIAWIRLWISTSERAHTQRNKSTAEAIRKVLMFKAEHIGQLTWVGYYSPLTDAIVVTFLKLSNIRLVRCVSYLGQFVANWNQLEINIRLYLDVTQPAMEVFAAMLTLLCRSYFHLVGNSLDQTLNRSADCECLSPTRLLFLNILNSVKYECNITYSSVSIALSCGESLNGRPCLVSKQWQVMCCLWEQWASYTCTWMNHLNQSTLLTTFPCRCMKGHANIIQLYWRCNKKRRQGTKTEREKNKIKIWLIEEEEENQRPVFDAISVLPVLLWGSTDDKTSVIVHHQIFLKNPMSNLYPFQITHERLAHTYAQNAVLYTAHLSSNAEQKQFSKRQVNDV